MAVVEMAPDHLRAEVILDITRDQEAEVIIEGNEMPIECGIISRRKTETIARVHAGGFRLRPAEDVARPVDIRNIETSDAAGISVNIENHCSENGLIDARRPVPQSLPTLLVQTLQKCLGVGNFLVQSL